MDEALQKKADQLIKNYELLRKGNAFEHEPLIVAGAALYLASGVEVDPERLKACKKLLKKKKGVFSDFRGITEFIVRCKMALSDDPEAYLDRLDAAFRGLKSFFSGSQVLLAAMVVADLAAPEAQGEVVEKTRAIYKEMREAHPWLTSEEDMPFAALMAASGKDGGAVYEEAEKVYDILRQDMKLGSDTRQMLSHVLALYQGHAESKCARVRRIAEGLKKAGHPLRRDRYIAILGTLAGSARPEGELVAQISEADDYLKQYKPFYGLFGVGKENRRMTAVQLVTALLDENGAGGLPNVAVSSVVSTTIEVTIITILLLCAVLAATSASTSS